MILALGPAGARKDLSMNKRITVVAVALALAAGAAWNNALEKTASVPSCSSKGSSCLMPEACAAAAKPVAEKPAAKEQVNLVAYYFHGNFRCVSCRKIEEWTGKAVSEGFAKEIKSGRVQWRPVNVEVKGNEHFVKDYKLYTKSVVLSETKNGKEARWKNLDKVWTLLGDEAAFKKYVRDEVSAYLKSK